MRLIVPTQVIIGVNVLTVVVIVGGVVAPYAGSAASGFTQGPYSHSVSTRTLVRTETTTYAQGTSSSQASASTSQTQTSPTLSPPSNAGGSGPSIAETVTTTVTVGSTTTEVSTSSTTFTNTTTLTTTTTLPASTTTTTETATRTVTRTETATSTTTATTTATSTVTSTVGSTSTSTETVTSPPTTTTTEVLTVTSATTVTATTSVTSTQTTTETSTSTETGATATAGLVPTASSLICRAAADDSYHCTDNVYSADLGVLQGSVSWTSSDSGGSFTDERCAPTQQQWIQGSPAEVTCTATYAADTGSGASAIQNITAAYSGDAYHASSSQTYTLFVGQSTSPTVFVSVECNDPYPQTGQSEPCTATVTDANGLGLNGTVSWTVSPGQAGSFSEASQSADQCSRQGGDGQGVTLTCQVGFDPSAGGVAVITAAYSHDADHSNGSGSFALYPQDTSSYLASGFNYMLGGSILGGGVAIAAVGLSKRKRDQRQSR